MKTTLLYFLTYCLLLGVFCLNLNNNACRSLLAYITAPISSQCYVNPDVYSSVPACARRNGYNLKTHVVTTDDGYELTIFEISLNVTKRLPIFMQHGLTSNSLVWVDKGNRSLAFYLAKRGFRVFLGNIRGNSYSKLHRSLNINDELYWNFSLDTLAAKDISTQLGYVYKQSEQKMHYIGHSMGTTLALMFASTFNDSANQWVQSFSLLGPVTYLHGTPLLEILKIPFIGLSKFLNFTGIKGFFRTDTYLQVEFCKLMAFHCHGALELMYGKSTNFPKEDLLLFVSNPQGGTSLYQLQQYLQILMSRRFQHFSYGAEGNMRTYTQEVPPLYDLSKVKVPTCLFYGKNDRLYTQENIDRTYQEIGSAKKCKYSITSATGPYNHLDFTYSGSVVKDLYGKILNFIDKPENSRSVNINQISNGTGNGNRSVLAFILFVCIQLVRFIVW